MLRAGMSKGSFFRQKHALGRETPLFAVNMQLQKVSVPFNQQSAPPPSKEMNLKCSPLLIMQKLSQRTLCWFVIFRLEMLSSDRNGKYKRIWPNTAVKKSRGILDGATILVLAKNHEHELYGKKLWIHSVVCPRKRNHSQVRKRNWSREKKENHNNFN